MKRQEIVVIQLIVDPVTRSQHRILQDILYHGRFCLVRLRMVDGCVSSFPLSMRAQLNSVVLCHEQGDVRAPSWLEHQEVLFKKMFERFPSVGLRVIQEKFSSSAFSLQEESLLR